MCPAIFSPPSIFRGSLRCGGVTLLNDSQVLAAPSTALICWDFISLALSADVPHSGEWLSAAVAAAAATADYI